jgi:hypothetical protein
VHASCTCLSGMALLNSKTYNAAAMEFVEAMAGMILPDISLH